jgi:DNA-binding MarR family transcriptional regulator
MNFCRAITIDLSLSLGNRKKRLDSKIEILHNGNMNNIEKKNIDTKMEKQARELMLRMRRLLETIIVSGKHPLPDLAVSPREVKAMILLGDKGETTMTELATAIDTPLSTVTRIADKLEQKGLIERSRSDRDRRIVVVAASEKGKMLHDSAQEHQFAMSYKMLELLGSDEREVFLELIAKMAKGLGEVIS